MLLHLQHNSGTFTFSFLFSTFSFFFISSKMASLFQEWLLVAAPPSLCTSSHNAMQCTSPNSLQYFWNTMHTQWKGACLLVLGHSWGPQKCSLGWSCAQNHKVEENSQALHCNTRGRVIILELNISPSPFCTLYMLHKECVPLAGDTIWMCRVLLSSSKRSRLLL